MPEDDVHKELADMQVRLALVEQKLSQVDMNVNKINDSLSRILWIIGGGFIASFVAWIIKGGLQ